MPRQIAKLIFLSVIFAALAPIANADPVVIDGTVTLIPGPLPSGVQTGPYVITGTNFSANVFSSVGVFGVSPCSPNQAGTPTPCTGGNLSWTAIGTDTNGSYTINGTTVPIDVVHQLSLFFNGPAFVIPPELFTASDVLVTAPFTFTGLAVTPDGNNVIDLIGEGTVRLLLRQRSPQGVNGLFLERAVYTFGPKAQGVTVQAVPEPATLLLLGSGLSGVLMFVKRRRKTGND